MNKEQSANFENAVNLENETKINLENANAENAAKQAQNIINARYGQRRSAVVAALRPLFVLIRANYAARNVAVKKSLPAETAKNALDVALGELRDILVSQAVEPLNAASIRVCGDCVTVIKKDDGGEFDVTEKDLEALRYKQERNAEAGSTLELLAAHLREATEKQVERDAARKAAAEAKKAQKEPKVSNAEVLAAVKDGTLTVVKKIDANK